jgi:hypothetical protein
LQGVQPCTVYWHQDQALARPLIYCQVGVTTLAQRSILIAILKVIIRACENILFIQDNVRRGIREVFAQKEKGNFSYYVQMNPMIKFIKSQKKASWAADSPPQNL